MATITLKDIPPETHAQLTRAAAANRRSMKGEVLRRLEISFELESALNSKRDAQWIKEAMESGPEIPLTRKEFGAAVQRGLAGAKKAV